MRKEKNENAGGALHIDLLRCQLPRKYIHEKSPHSLQENIRNNEIVVLYVWAPFTKK